MMENEGPNGSFRSDVESSGIVPAALPPPEPMFGMTNSINSGISVDDEAPGFDRGHSLPNVDELKTDHNAKSAEFLAEDGEYNRARGGRVVLGALFLALVVIAVVIGVAVAVSNDKSSSSSTNSATQTQQAFTGAPVIDQKPTDGGKPTGADATPVPVAAVPATPPPSTAPPQTPAPNTAATPELRTSQIKQYLVDQNISDQADLDTEGSPQFRALQFMATGDDLAVAVPAGAKSTPKGYDFMTRYVMAVLFYGTFGDHQWVYTLNFLQPSSVCFWYSVLQYPDSSQEFRGVACDEDGKVAALYLTQNNMEGPMPKELGQLTSLLAIDFDFNLLSGPIPDSFQSLTLMRNFFASGNRLSGPIPSWIDSLKAMLNINFSHNLLTGRLPTTIGNLPNIKGLALDNNLFTNNLDGVFDTDVIPGFRQLEQLYLENNQLTGTLGSHFGLETNLTYFDISDNRFRGSIPSHLFEMPSMTVLDLHDNEFTTLPTFPANNKLGLLALQKNNFENMKVPSSLSQLAALQHLDVSQNKFTGVIPTELGYLTNLSYLFLADNEFTAQPVPSWLESLTQLEELSLKSTQRTGPIPSFMGNLKKMVLLDLDENNLEGTIPSNLGGLEDLHILLLNRNNLTSAIPSSFALLRSLKLLFLEANTAITGDLNQLFCDNPAFRMKPVIVANCDLCNAAVPECCTACCEEGQECNQGIHVPDLDPIWQLSYQRVFFAFGSEDYFSKERAGNVP